MRGTNEKRECHTETIMDGECISRRVNDFLRTVSFFREWRKERCDVTIFTKTQDDEIWLHISETVVVTRYCICKR